MRRTTTPKTPPRKKIVQAAANAFNRCGFDGIGIADIMKDAGLTPGAFSWHFNSKEELIQESLEQAFQGRNLQEDPEWKDRPLDECFREYLSRDVKNCCPAINLTPEIARRPRATRSKFNAHLSGVFAGLAKRLPAKMTAEERQTTAMAIFAMLMGAAQLSRVAKGTDMSEALIEAALSGANKLMKK